MIRITPIFYFIGRAELKEKIDVERGAQAPSCQGRLMKG
jgi:hypothetical protein